jgi:5'-nucleotidase, C-terminal domain
MVSRTFVVSMIVVASLVAGPSLAQDGSQAPAKNPDTVTSDVDVLFTGRLLGYFRNPSLQSGTTVPNDFPCPRVTNDPEISAEGTKLLRAAQSYQYESRLFVGTGDNFAVYMPSRILEPPPSRSSPKYNQYEKDQFDWDWQVREPKWVKPTPISITRDLRNGLAVVPTDNVGCFLSYAGYDAIVPGKEDFYFGADRLRALAHFLASIPKTDNSSYHPVQMLAANLLVKTSWFKDHDPIPDSKKPRLPFTISDSSQTPYMTFPSDGAEILPWLADIEGVFDRAVNTPEVVISASGGAPDRADWTSSVNSSGVRIHFSNSARCWAVRGIPNYDVSGNCALIEQEDIQPVPSEKDKAVHRLRWRLPLDPLAPGNYKVCVWVPDSSKQPVDYSVPPICSRFSVGIPLFQYPDPHQLSSTTGPQSQRKFPSPYLVKRVCSHFDRGTCQGEWNTVAVFGVVDPAMEQKIGKLESDWRAVVQDGKKNADCKNDPNCDNDKNAKKYETALEVIDPANSLKQLIDYLLDCGKYGNSTQGDVCYGAARDNGPELKFKSKILLAQMDAGTASLLAAHLKLQYHFETVISEYDLQQFTRNQITVIDATLSPSGASSEELACDNQACDVPSFVAVPPPAWDPNWNDDPVRVLRVSRLDENQFQYVISGTTTTLAGAKATCDQCVDNAAESALASSRRPVQQDFKLSPTSLEKLAQTLTPMLPPSIPANLSSPLDETRATKLLENVTLLAMLNATRADVAILQKHDFYLPIPVVDCLLRQLAGGPSAPNRCAEIQSSPGPDRYAWQKILDALIWKGDILTVIPVRGSVLLSIMKDSRQFDALDQSGLSLVKETDRGLVTLGIKADGFKDSYLINDLPLDPDRLYSVATTDYVALGDTGYPELIDPTVPHFPRPLWDHRPLQYISSIVCTALVPTLRTGNDMDCTSSFSGKDYFDELYVQAPAPPAGNTWEESWKTWFLFGPRLGQDDPKVKPKPNLEDWAQEQPPIWRFSLNKTSIGFTLQRHSDTQASLNSNFGGVSNPQATAPRSHSWNTDQEASFVYNHHAWDFVASEALLYTASFTDAKSGLYRNPNQSTDSVSLLVGPRLHLPGRRKLPHWGIGTYLNYSTQPFAVEESLSLTKNQVDVPTPLQFFVPRVHALTDRLGLGRYDQKSYFEVGIEGGEAFGAFKQFDIFTNGALVLTCVPSATLSLQKCIGKLGDTIVTPTSLVRTIQSSRALTGIYWHSFLNFPTGKTMSASLENQGEFYFNNAGNNSTDTRFQHLTTAKYSFQVWPSLSFAPTYQIFLYENKQAYKFLWQQQAMITINFNFDWTSQRTTASQLRYSAAQPK